MTVSNGKSAKEILWEVYGAGAKSMEDGGGSDQEVNEALAALEEIYKVTGETSDGYHTFNELYSYREAYNAALFNEWASQKKYKVHKSWHHSDEPHEPIFGGGWFIVMAELPTGQISNHYQAEYWDDFKIPETPVAHAWDGHTPQQALERLRQAFSNGGGDDSI